MTSHLTLSLIFILSSAAKVNKYIYSLTKNYLSYLKSVQNKPNLPPKKNIRNLINKEKKESKSKFITSKVDLKSKNDNIKQIPILKTSKEDLISPNEYEIKSYNSKNLNVNTESNLNNKDKKSKINDQIIDEKFFKEYMSTSLDDLEFDDAVAKDKRTFCEHMVENLKEDQIIANTFISEDPLKPRTIKIIIFILNVILYFVINGLFFSEEVISELYNVNEEEENFFSFIPRSIERLIYTTLVSIIIGIITDFFFIDEIKIKGIFRREKNNTKVLKKNITEIMKDLKRRYISFIIIVSIILIISFLYLLCFNYVYPYSQIEWIKSSIAIMIIMQILSTLKCVLETSLRFLSYKFNSEKLYKVSKFLD